MRILLTAAISVLLLGLPGMSAVFDCPLPATASESCSHCDGETEEGEEKQSCPRSVCVLICPYTAQSAALLTSDNRTVTVLPVAALDSGLATPLVFDTARISTPTRRAFDAAPVYLVNRALLL